MDDIKQWLNGGGSWDAGVELVLKYCKNPLLRQVFMEGHTPYKAERLRKTLLEIVATGVVVKKVQDTAKQTVLQIVTQAPKGWGPVESMDPVIKALYLQWKPLFLQMNDLQSRLYDVAKRGLTDKAAKMEAGEMAHRILDLDDQCDDFYQKRDHYRATGALPAQTQGPDDLVVDPKKWPTALANAQRYVRDYRKKVETNPKDEKSAQQLAKWQQRVLHYQKLLNG